MDSFQVTIGIIIIQTGVQTKSGTRWPRVGPPFFVFIPSDPLGNCFLHRALLSKIFLKGVTVVHMVLIQNKDHSEVVLPLSLLQPLGDIGGSGLNTRTLGPRASSHRSPGTSPCSPCSWLSHPGPYVVSVTFGTSTGSSPLTHWKQSGTALELSLGPCILFPKVVDVALWLCWKPVGGLTVSALGAWRRFVQSSQRGWM